MISSQNFRQPAVCKLTVDGEEISELMPYLVEATVEMSRKAPAICTLVFDTIRLEDNSWVIQDSGHFVPWKPLMIEAVFESYSEEVMRGYIKEIKAETPEQMGKAKVIVVCQDESLLLNREHIRKRWSSEDEPMTDGEITREIGSDFFTVEAEDGMTNVTLNQDSTHVQLLRNRAEANGFEFYIRAGTLYFQPPQLDEEAQNPLLVYAGDKTNCLRFSVSHDGHKPDEVSVVRAADIGTELEQESYKPNLTLLGRDATTSESMGLSPFAWQMPRPPGGSLQEVKARAQAKANENAWKLTADGELDGLLYGHVLLTHKPVGVYGVGDTYSGLYYVDSVTHIFAQDGYRQAFKLLRNATGKNSEPESADALAGVR